MITLSRCPRTRASRILWLLEEMNEPFEARFIDIRLPGPWRGTPNSMPEDEGWR
jgi:hypothetical protein